MSRSELEQWVSSLDPQMISAWLWRYTKSLQASEREDLIQDVRSRLLEIGAAELLKLRDADALRALAIVIARNVGVDWLRQQATTLALHLDTDVGEIEDHRNNPERKVIANEELQMLVAALRKMPKKRRSVVEYTKILGYSIDETAQRLKIKDKTVKSHLRLATLWCAKQLDAKKSPEMMHVFARLFERVGPKKKGERRSARPKLVEPTE